MDRGLPSVRSARGLQGRQELGRMLVCVTDFVLRLGALGQLLRETSKRGQEEPDLHLACCLHSLAVQHFQP